jgi:alcohol dehydrogenase (cytochrome c)
MVRQTWAKGFDDKGRPEVIPGNEPTPEGADHIFPGVDGGANWMSHSYSPLTRLLYVFARDERRLFSKNAIRHMTPEEVAATSTAEVVAGGGRGGAAAAGGRGGRGGGGGNTNGIFGAGGNLPTGGGGGGRGRARFLPEESWGKVIAIDPLTGNIKWEHKVISPPWGGVMSTAGNLVFGGTTEGVIFALDARTGERLWYFLANDRVYASPISYLANGKQYVSLAVGDVLLTFGL